jgi:hypothetical protein
MTAAAAVVSVMHAAMVRCCLLLMRSSIQDCQPPVL